MGLRVPRGAPRIYARGIRATVKRWKPRVFRVMRCAFTRGSVGVGSGSRVPGVRARICAACECLGY